MKNKKVLLIGRASKNIGGISTGGIAKHIEDLSVCLTNKGVNVSVWDFTIQKSFVTNNKVNVIAVPYLQKFIGLLYGFFILNIFFSEKYRYLSIRDKIIVSFQSYKLKNEIIKHGFRTIHIHSLNRPISVFLRKTFPDLKIVITDHGFWQKLEKTQGKISFEKTFEKINKNINLSDTVIVISEFSIEKLKEYGLSLKNIKKIPNPVYVSNIPISYVEKEKIIFFNGYNESLRRKNLPILIEAINSNETLYKNYKLIAIVEDEAKSYIKKLNLNFEIQILGSQPWQEIVKLYNKSKVLVVPSKSESFGLVYIEALAVGTPVVGFYKTIDEFQKVLQVEMGEQFNSNLETADKLANKIIKAASKEYDRRHIRNKVIENYDWGHKVDDFINIYKF